MYVYKMGMKSIYETLIMKDALAIYRIEKQIDE